MVNLKKNLKLIFFDNIKLNHILDCDIATNFLLFNLNLFLKMCFEHVILSNVNRCRAIMFSRSSSNYLFKYNINGKPFLRVIGITWDFGINISFELTLVIYFIYIKSINFKSFGSINQNCMDCIDCNYQRPTNFNLLLSLCDFE